jgi:hypothetical protein
MLEALQPMLPPQRTLLPNAQLHQGLPRMLQNQGLLLL